MKEQEGDQTQEIDDLSNGADEVDYPPNNYIYRVVDIFFIVIGIFTYYVDWGFDVLTAYNHWMHGDFTWFYLTVLFICVPSIVMSAVSLYWYIKDHNNPEVPKASATRWVIRVFMLLLQQGPILRYVDSLYYGLRSRRYWKEGDKKRQRQYYTWMLYEDGDCVLLRLFECFMEAAPQLVLQLYILSLVRKSEYGSKWMYVLSIGCITSLVSLAWGVTSHARGSRFTCLDKNNINLKGSVVLLLWHIFSIGARVIAMVLFASKFRLWLFVVCFAHWFLMVVWLMARRSLAHACSHKLGEVTLSFVLAAVYIFSFINEKEEPTKYKYIAYYIICEFENVIMVVLWLIYANPDLWYYIPGAVFHFVSFFLAMVLMVAYYSFFHPTRPRITQNRRKPPLPADGEGSVPHHPLSPVTPTDSEPQLKVDLIESNKTQVLEASL
ncbi:XK-related protein 4-like [Macrobrachium nipponense]|uniref:XK-related protein 4-like n=1 Tax=Macrobrachium nipponense TaxID=159736 RepID=UPI0030C811C4